MTYARKMLGSLGIDINEENFRETPQRIVDAYIELMEGRGKEDRVEEILNTSFSSNYDGILTVKDITAHGICPHHMLPIGYDIDFAYIPKGQVLGLSKIPRVVKLLAKRPILQETLTQEITDVFAEHVEPEGVMCIVRGRHQCMRSRGVKTDSVVTTSSLEGVFMEEAHAKREALKLLGVDT